MKKKRKPRAEVWKMDLALRFEGDVRKIWQRRIVLCPNTTERLRRKRAFPAWGMPLQGIDIVHKERVAQR